MLPITQLLDAAAAGDRNAAAQLLPLVYEELRKLAASRLSGELPGQTLQPTDLVHEAYLRLVNPESPQPWNGRSHFFAAAAEAMRRILVENVRRKRRLRHGGGRQRVPLEESQPAEEPADDRLLAMDEALAVLAREEQQVAEVVKLRFFVGLTIEQAAEALDISVRTANRHWAYGRAWLFQHLS